MDSKLSLALMLVILAAGCTDITDGGTSTTPQSSSEGKGLEIVSFSVSDPTLSPGQQAILRLEMKNHHIDPIEIESMELYNTGKIIPIDEGSWSSHCGTDTIQPSEHGVSQPVVCTWKIEAPSKEELGAFESRSYSPKLQIVYDSVMSNKKRPLKVQFQDIEDIQQTRTISETYNNQEVSISVEAENPVPIEGSSSLAAVIDSSGNGNLVSGYTVDFTPKSIFDDKCASEITKEPVIEDRIEISCTIKSDSSKVVERNIIVSTSYKYQKFPSVNIEVVNK